ncbi:GNAT family N-acetyltransferase [Leptolyngbya ohadii]|uniref:GNAT family N-acetyltransferase n=1 Tax=Leptolyngbya ohadii TaxID=1962290 RepID=UPI001CEC6D20|nr:GNAT family N-acetyltransferase [Leptolyngbya ohadii]
MNFLKLEPLTADLLPAVVELDRRCLGGLWSLDGYRREIESPNSDLLVLKRDLILSSADCEVYEGIDSGGVELRPAFAPQPPINGGLPNRSLQKNSKLRASEICDSDNPVDIQSPPLVGDLGGDAGSITSNQQPSSVSLIGLGCLWSIAEEAHITVLAIDPDYRQLGLGQAILYALLVSAEQRGLEWATLEVRAGNAAAIRLYEKFGFREVGRRKGYYSDGEDALILWRSGLQKPEFRLWVQECERTVRDRLKQAGYEIILEPALQTAFT